MYLYTCNDRTVNISSSADDLAKAGRALAAAQLVDAFGHVSVRLSDTDFLITPPCPLGQLGEDARFAQISVRSAEIPAGIPREAWIHIALMRTRPDIGAICRAQPRAATAVTAAGLPILPLHGQSALLGDEVKVFPSSRLIRDRSLGEQLAEHIGDASACVLAGNGAVTVGDTVAHAVARMWILEASAQLNALAASAGNPVPLTPEERAAWAATGGELLDRIWKHLTTPTHPATSAVGSDRPQSL